MKRKFISVLTLSGVAILGFGALVACNGSEPKVSTEVTGMTISNKSDLEAEWKIGDSDRQLQFTFSGATINPANAISKGLLKITSSDSNVVAVNGSYVSTIGAGSATVTASYTNTEADGGSVLTDSVVVTVKESDTEKAAIDATVKEFIEATIPTDSNGNLVNKEIYRVKGKISKWKDTNTDGTKYGNFYLKDDTGAEVLIYGATASNKSLSYADGKWSFTKKYDWLEDSFTSSLKIGDEVTMMLTRCDYKGTIEGNGWVIAGSSRANGTSATLEEVINDSNLTAGNKLFETEATILGFGKTESGLSESASDATQYGNFYLTDGTNTMYVYGATAGTGALTWTGSKYKFNNPKDFLTNEVTSGLKKGDKIKFTCVRADYNGTKEISIEDVKLVTE